MACSITSVSTQPPLIEPATSPWAVTAIFAPGGGGGRAGGRKPGGRAPAPAALPPLLNTVQYLSHSSPLLNICTTLSYHYVLDCLRHVRHPVIRVYHTIVLATKPATAVAWQTTA